MSAAQDALALARRHGVNVEINGNRLRLHAQSEPPLDVLAALREHKTEIVSALTAPATESLCMMCGKSANDADSNVAHDNLVDVLYRRVHVSAECYDKWFVRSFGRKPQPANLNRA